MPDVAHIPAELWRDIIPLACVDGGFTGRSLALTSTFFHAQSLCDRFHSLSFKSLQQIEDFLTFLHLRQTGCQPRIKHLYLSFLDEPVKLPLHSLKAYSRMTRDQRRAHDTNTHEDSRACWDGRFCVASMTLLTLAARTLCTLCVVEDGVAPLPLIFPCEFPQLQELSWKGRILAFESCALDAAGTSRFTATFPALERIHIITPAVNDIVPTVLLIRIPSVRYFRMSNAGYADILLPDALSMALGVTPSHHSLVREPEDRDVGQQRSSVSSRSMPLPHLRQVIIHGTPSAPGGWCGHYSREWARIHSQLESLARGQLLVGTHMLVMERPWWKSLRWPHRLRDHWLDRIQGGRGCWVESEAEEAASEVCEYGPL